MTRLITLFLTTVLMLSATVSCTSENPAVISAGRNLERAIEMTDAALGAYMSKDRPGYMFKYYNPYTDRVTDSKNENVWEYSSAIEAVTDIMLALKMQKENGYGDLYDTHFSKYRSVLDNLYTGLQYFKGTYRLTSYTRKDFQWTVYGVPRASSPGANDVTGKLNVYDDQMWLIRDFIDIYCVTGDKKYLEEAEYLAEYVIDGYDCHPDKDGNEYGGITWGPGYTSKHSCSNGPVIAPLVWLSEKYKGTEAKAVRYSISPEDGVTRKTEEMDRSSYYLYYAEKIYEYQKKHLLREDGVYDDMMGGAEPGKIYYKDGYRGHNELTKKAGPALSYNSGTMISGAVALYRATGKAEYLEDAERLTDASFRYFARPDATVEGLYTYDFHKNNSWFNSVLLRGFIDATEYYDGAALPVDSFQKIYDHAYTNFLYKGLMPVDLYLGWAAEEGERQVRGRDQFAYAAQFAMLAKYDLERSRR